MMFLGNAPANKVLRRCIERMAARRRVTVALPCFAPSRFLMTAQVRS
jgi:hypothetical protein